jgi:hypothetical protein
MTLIRRRRSVQERAIVAQRMTPGVAGGRSAMVAPQPKDPPRLDTVSPAGVDHFPLPWGARGDSPLFGHPWYGVYTDEAAAAAETGPSFNFGIGAAGDSCGLAIMVDTADFAATAQGYASLLAWDSDITFLLKYQDGGGFAEVVVDANSAFMETASPDASTVPVNTYVGSDDGLGIFYLFTDVPGTGTDHEFYGKVDIEGAAMLLDSKGGSPTVHLRVEARASLDDDIAYVEISEASEPDAPGITGGRLFVRDNGAGKSQLCIRFASGASQVIATEP